MKGLEYLTHNLLVVSGPYGSCCFDSHSRIRREHVLLDERHGTVLGSNLEATIALGSVRMRSIPIIVLQVLLKSASVEVYGLPDSISERRLRRPSKQLSDLLDTAIEISDLDRLPLIGIRHHFDTSQSSSLDNQLGHVQQTCRYS